MSPITTGALKNLQDSFKTSLNKVAEWKIDEMDGKGLFGLGL